MSNVPPLTSLSNEWYTPKWIIERARTVLWHIDLDPASCAMANEVVQADKFYTLEDDGLKQEWEGNIWLNPPYGKLTTLFVDKLIDEWWPTRGFYEALVLVKCAPDTKWFKKLLHHAYYVAFAPTRIKFYNRTVTQSAPTFPSALFYFGNSRTCGSFLSVFIDWQIVTRVKMEDFVV